MGVQKTVLVEGNGPSPQNGDVVTMLYTGWLKEAGKKDQKGKQFDTTEKPGRGPFKTPIGVGRVIKGTYENMPHRIHFPSLTHIRVCSTCLASLVHSISVSLTLTRWTSMLCD